MAVSPVPARTLVAASTLTVAAAAAVAFLAAPADAAPQTVTTWAQLKAAVAADKNVELGADISQSDDSLVVSAAKPVEIDLNNHQLSISGAAGQSAVDIPSGGKLVVQDLIGHGSLTATGGTGGAGIHVGPNAVYIQRDYAVTASGGSGAAGIGGTSGERAGRIVIVKGIVTATGGTGAAGIGGGVNGAGGSITLNGGQVTATGGTGGAGVGGGADGHAGLTLTMDHASLDATGGTGAAAVGAGDGGTTTAAVTVGSEGILDLTSPSGSPVPPPVVTLGSLSNAGIVRVRAGATLSVPAGTTVQNSGLIRAFGSLTGPGTIHNTGIILPSVGKGQVGDTGQVQGNGQGPAGSTLLVDDHNYTISFVLDGAQGTAPSVQHVYAATIAQAKQELPAVPTISGYTGDGWYTAATGGTKVENDTVLSTVADYGPSPLVLHARYTATSPTTSSTSTAPTSSSNSSGSGIGGVSASRPAGSTSSSGGAGIDAESTSRANTELASTGTDTGNELVLALMLLGAGLVMLLFGGRARPRSRAVRKH